MKKPLCSSAAIALLLVVLAACADEDSERSDSTPIAGDETAMGHIHGIGINPADDSLYVATHFGLFHVLDGQASRVADRWQDTMAFTVVGDNHFLGSGHPDLREDLPPHLGLIESTDAGQTWQALALQGEADFHALEPAGDLLYGVDAITGTLLVTENRRTFRDVIALQALDLAADPDEPVRVLATTHRGQLLTINADTGAERPVSAPPLAFVDWPRTDLLVGLSPDGEVHTSADGGATWVEAGQVPGEAAALEATEDEWYAATSEGLFRSTDAGITWSPVQVAGS